MIEAPGSRRKALAWIILFLLGACLGSRGADAAGECPQAPPESWTRTETAAWESLLRGEEFDAETFSPERIDRRFVRGSFVRTILTCEALTASLSQFGVALRGVVIPETVDLRLAEVLVRFSCIDCLLAKIDGRKSAWRKALILDGSMLRDGLDLGSARFDDEVRARGLQSDSDVLLDQASVSGGLDLRGLRSPGRLSMRDGQVGGKLRLDGAQLAELDLGGATIDGQLILSGIRIGRDAILDRVRIGRDLLLRTYPGGPEPGIGLDYSIEEARERILNGRHVFVLNNANIGGRLEIARTFINGPMSLDAVRVGEDVWLRDCSHVAGPIQMPFARIGQNLDLSTTTLSSVDATGTKIGGELRLGTTGSARLTSPIWTGAAKIVLRNASVSAWVDAADSRMPRNESCPPVDGETDPWPPKIDVIGFSYERAGGLGGGTEAERPGHWYVAWLDRQEPYSLDPYRRLAAFLKTNGRDSTANSVLLAGKEQQFAHSSGVSTVLLFLQKIFVGYGIHTWYIFGWVIGFIVLGGVIFSRTDEARKMRMPYCISYSTDMFLPFVQLRKLHGEIDFRGPVRYYLYFHKFMGWVCASFFLGALVGLFEV